MDTDIIAGIEAGIETVLVLTGVTSEKDLEEFAYRPDHIVRSVGDLAAGTSE
jgi:NagD protein